MAHIFVCASAQHGSQISDPDIRVPVRDRKANGTFRAETKGHPENSVLDSVQVFASWGVWVGMGSFPTIRFCWVCQVPGLPSEKVPSGTKSLTDSNDSAWSTIVTASHRVYTTGLCHVFMHCTCILCFHVLSLWGVVIEATRLRSETLT